MKPWKIPLSSWLSHCHPGTSIRTLSALSGKVNNIPSNSWHFPPINSCLPQSTWIYSPFLVCSFGESEQIFHESVALSPGTKLDNRFYGYSACIPRPSYQGKVNQFTANSRHFPPISLRLPLSICIHSPFLVCFSRESAPVCREFEALSPGTKSDNRFYGYSACILCPSYQGKVNQFSTNLRHFPLENIDPTSIFAVFSWESEPNSHESVALSREYCSSPPEILFLRYSSSALSGKAFHVILEQPVHDNFECIDNQVISKKGAHFGRLKLSKCALEFLLY